MTSCVGCLSVANNFVCKDNVRDTAAYCCPTGSISNSCRRNYCSPMALTTSMKFFSCPYEPRTCGSTSSRLVAELGKIYTVQANTINFVQNSICYWTIRSNISAAGRTAPNNTFLEIRGNKLQSVSLYVNTGRTPNLATNETTVGTFSSTTLTYKGD
jgi:hypothetical protein